MEPRNSYLLPFSGLLLPVALYLVVASFIAPILSSLQISNDLLLGVLMFCYLLVISYSYSEAKSQHKFFKKHFTETSSMDEVTDDSSSDTKITFRRGTAFFINVVGNLIAISLWIFSNGVGFSNIYYQVAALILIMFLASNIFKIFATSLYANINYATAINSLKFAIASDVFWYGLIGAFFLFLGGFFV